MKLLEPTHCVVETAGLCAGSSAGTSAARTASGAESQGFLGWALLPGAVRPSVRPSIIRPCVSDQAVLRSDSTPVSGKFQRLSIFQKTLMGFSSICKVLPVPRSFLGLLAMHRGPARVPGFSARCHLLLPSGRSGRDPALPQGPAGKWVTQAGCQATAVSQNLRTRAGAARASGVTHKHDSEERDYPS